MNLTLLDYAIIAIPFLLVLGVNFLQRGSMKSVADFLAAGRCAGRYLIATSAGEAAAGVVLLVTALEMFQRTGFSLNFWGSIAGIITMLLPLIGLVVYRYRETRSLTFHQFFEVRYSKGIRVYSSFINVFAGLFNFGIQPAIGARFMVYFLGLPESISWGGVVFPTFVPIMLFLVGFALWMAVLGGQITIMVSDFLEGVLSMLLYIVIAVVVLSVISIDQVHEAMLSGEPGKSFVDPFDINGQPDFNGFYMVISVLFGLYIYRGYAWQQGAASAARNAHEGKMAGILAGWRSTGGRAMMGIVSVAAFTVLHHPDFAAQRVSVEAALNNISNPQLQTQMAMPVALGVLLGPGVKGALCAIAVFGFLISMAVQLHGFGSTFLQDVVLPLRKTHLEGVRHVRWLRMSVLGIAVFACFFSMVYQPVEYLIMLTSLIGAIYFGGIGALVWGGLYWSRGTVAGAWTAMLTGTVLSVAFNLVQQFWKPLAEFGQSALPTFASFFAEHAEKCPWNGMILACIAAAIAASGYVIVSLLTCREPHSMEKLLHRGEYAVEGEKMRDDDGKFRWAKVIGLDDNMTRGDRGLTIFTFAYGMFWKMFSISVVLWTIFVGRLSPEWWFGYAVFTALYLPLVIGGITTVWFTWGGARDMIQLLKDLKQRRLSAASETDDGTFQKDGGA
ncbi:MAG: hypothetical protein Fur0032_09970 [Terrimicrobiaceae bacterium]